MKRQLRIGASALALVSGMAGAAMAQDSFYDLTAENTENVELNSSEAIITTGGGIAGPGSSVAAMAIGASASVSARTTDGATHSPLISENSTVEATNAGNISVSEINLFLDTDYAVPNISGTAASGTISATGATASVSETVIGTLSSEGGAQSSQIGIISTTAENTLPGEGAQPTMVTAKGNNIAVGSLAGDASGISISASGAAANVSSTLIGVNGSGFVAAAFGASTDSEPGITQSATNDQNVETLGNTIFLDSTGVPSGNLSGAGASANIGAVGASTNVRATLVDSSLSSALTLGAGDNQGILQTTTNTGDVTVGSGGEGNDITISGNISGHGAGASISAVGASASVGESYTNSSIIDTGAVNFGNIETTVHNSGNILVDNAAIDSGSITDGGVGASVSIAAVGASGSASTSIIDGTVTVSSGLGSVTQAITNSAGVTVSNSNITVAGLNGAGSSAVISAVGASASVGVSTIN